MAAARLRLQAAGGWDQSKAEWQAAACAPGRGPWSPLPQPRRLCCTCRQPLKLGSPGCLDVDALCSVLLARVGWQRLRIGPCTPWNAFACPTVGQWRIRQSRGPRSAACRAAARSAGRRSQRGSRRRSAAAKSRHVAAWVSLLLHNYTSLFDQDNVAKQSSMQVHRTGTAAASPAGQVERPSSTAARVPGTAQPCAAAQCRRAQGAAPACWPVRQSVPAQRAGHAPGRGRALAHVPTQLKTAAGERQQSRGTEAAPKRQTPAGSAPPWLLASRPTGSVQQQCGHG